MMRLRLVLPVLVAFAAGCLKEGRPVVGQMLLAGREVEKPSFVTVGDALWVTYQVQRRAALAPPSGSYDFAMVSYGTAEVRPLLPNVSERGERGQAGGVPLIMVDENTVDGPGGGVSANLVARVRL